MPKHIKIRGKLTPDRKRVIVELLERTHYSSKFGDSKTSKGWAHGPMGFHIRGPIRIYSLSSSVKGAIVYEKSGSENYGTGVRKWVHLGAAGINSDPKGTLTLEEWAGLKQTVNDYNEYFKDK